MTKLTAFTNHWDTLHDMSDDVIHDMGGVENIIVEYIDGYRKDIGSHWYKYITQEDGTKKATIDTSKISKYYPNATAYKESELPEIIDITLPDDKGQVMALSDFAHTDNAVSMADIDKNFALPYDNGTAEITAITDTTLIESNSGYACLYLNLYFDTKDIAVAYNTPANGQITITTPKEVGVFRITAGRIRHDRTKTTFTPPEPINPKYAGGRKYTYMSALYVGISRSGAVGTNFNLTWTRNDGQSVACTPCVNVFSYDGWRQPRTAKFLFNMVYKDPNDIDASQITQDINTAQATADNAVASANTAQTTAITAQQGVDDLENAVQGLSQMLNGDGESEDGEENPLPSISDLSAKIAELSNTIDNINIPPATLHNSKRGLDVCATNTGAYKVLSSNGAMNGNILSLNDTILKYTYIKVWYAPQKPSGISQSDSAYFQDNPTVFEYRQCSVQELLDTDPSNNHNSSPLSILTHHVGSVNPHISMLAGQVDTYQLDIKDIGGLYQIIKVIGYK